MPTPLAELLPQIVTLNVDTQPFSYYAEGNQIIGWWDVAKAVRLNLVGLDQIDETYRLKVTLDERAGTYRSVDFSRNISFRGGASTGYDDDSIGGVGLFETRQPKSWHLQPERIKEPLFGWLHEHGWQQKRFLGLFG